MIHKIEHALVMDTDDIPGRGGYAVVGLSPGLTQAERTFVAENFGISDYLHDPQNDRAFYSFFRAPNARFAFVRRFTKGLRRSGSQSRVFVHTMFLDDATFDALHGLPWLLVDSKFRSSSSEFLGVPRSSSGDDDPSPPRNSEELRGTRGTAQHPLTLDYGPLIDAASFATLEWQPEVEVVDAPVRRLQTRLAVIGKRLGSVDPADAVASVLASLQQGRRALLPQGPAYELLTIVAWSMLPIGDRMALGWTQHDSQNVAADFAIANAPRAEFALAPNDVTRRIVSLNMAGEASWREFHTRARRYPLSIRGDAIGAWLEWRDAMLRVGDRLDQPDPIIVAELERLASSARPNRNDPWIDGAEVLQLLWPNIERAIANGRDPAQTVKEWGSRFYRSGLGNVIFHEPPSRAWLDRVALDIGADLLVRFYIFGTEGDEKGMPTRAAVAEWAIANRASLTTQVLALLAVRLARDRSALLAKILDAILDDPNGMTLLANETPVNANVGDMVLFASILAMQKKHPQAPAFVRGTLLAHLERSDETRKKVTEAVAVAVAAIVRDDVDTFVRFVQLLEPELQARVSALAAEWVRSDDRLPLARELVLRMPESYPRHGALAFAVAAAGEPADVWAHVVIGMAGDLDGRGESDATRRFVAHVEELENADLRGLLDALVAHLQQRRRTGAATRALVSVTRPVWHESPSRILAAVSNALQSTAGSVRGWDTLVAALARVPGASRADAGRMLVAFWTHVDASDVASVDREVVDLTRSRIDGEWRTKLIDYWKQRLKQLPERFIDLIAELEQGASLEVRIERAQRAIKQGNATVETLNQLDEDLWELDERAYGDAIGAAIRAYAGPRRRAERLIDLVAGPLLQPTVKLAIEEQLALELSRLSEDDWAGVARITPEKLARSGSVLMSVARQAGSSNAAGLEQLFRERGWIDALDGFAAGRIDAEGMLRRMWRRVSRR